ncbi:MAG TPA: RNA polymerase sigma factor [Allosphingosinicella sp.]|nr:RNA polymerase sigma factor [Allosphingosinicella sp.]
MPPPSEPDEILCRRAAGGDKGAFRLLVETHERRLRAFLRQLAGPDLGDELAQETFIKAWQSLAAFRGESKFSSWLCAIGWRLFVDQKRRQRSESRKREAAAELAETVAQPSAGDRVDLARALALLEPVERAALVLCEGHGWSHGEAAQILRIPLGTLKSHVRRAKLKCRENLK